VGVTARLSIVRHQVGARLVEVFLSQPFHRQFTRCKQMPPANARGIMTRPIPRARADCPMPSSSPMACFPLTRVPQYAMPNSSLHPAFAALPSAHPARGVADELRWGRCPLTLRGSLPTRTPNALVEPDGLHRTRSGLGSFSCFARPYRAARGLGSQALRQRPVWSLRASSTRPRATRLPPPPPELRGACGRAAHAHRDGVRAAASRASPRSRACPPESAGGRAGEGL